MICLSAVHMQAQGPISNRAMQTSSVTILLKQKQKHTQKMSAWQYNDAFFSLNIFSNKSFSRHLFFSLNNRIKCIDFRCLEYFLLLLCVCITVICLVCVDDVLYLF